MTFQAEVEVRASGWTGRGRNSHQQVLVFQPFCKIMKGGVWSWWSVGLLISSHSS